MKDKLLRIKSIIMIILLIIVLLFIPINLAIYAIIGDWIFNGERLFFGVLSVVLLYAIDYLYYKLKPLFTDELEEPREQE